MVDLKGLRRFPFLRLILPFLLGIIVAYYTNITIPFVNTSFFLLIPLFLFVFIKQLYSNYSLRWVSGFIIHLMLFLSGFGLLKLKAIEIQDLSKYNKTTVFVAHVIDDVVEKQNSNKSLLQIEYVISGDSLFKSDTKSIVYFEKDSLSKQLQYGDVILITSRINEISNPGNPDEFDYKRFMLNRGVTHSVYLKKDSWVAAKNNHGFIVFKLAKQFRNYILSNYRSSGIKDENFAVLSALTLGYKDEIDNETKQAFSNSGAMHVLAVSGLHVGIFYVIFSLVLKILDRNRYLKYLKAVIIILLLWWFAIITGLSPSVMRSSTMFTFIAIAASFNRKTNIYNTLAASAFILLLINPYQIMEVGFQMSYAAVIGIVSIQPKIYKLLYFKNWLLDKAWSLSAVSIAAQIATFPLSLYYFNKIPNYFLLTNLIVIPLVTILLYFSVVYCVFMFSEFVSQKLMFVIDNFLSFLNWFVKQVEVLPHSSISNISIDFHDVITIYLLILALISYLIYKKALYLLTSLSLILFLLIGIGFTSNITHDQKIFTVFNARGNAVYNIIDNQKNYLLYDTTKVEDVNKLMFYLKSNFIKIGAPDFTEIDLKSDFNVKRLIKKNNVIQFCDKKILIIDDYRKFKERINEKVDIDYLIVSNNIKVNFKEILLNIKPKIVVIDSSNKFYKSKAIEMLCEKHSIKCHNVNKDGAFIIKIS